VAACRAVICAALWPDPGDPLCPAASRTTAIGILTSATVHRRTTAASDTPPSSAFTSPQSRVQRERSVHRLPSKADSPTSSCSPFGKVAVHRYLHVGVQRTRCQCVSYQNQRPNCTNFPDLPRV
jgi:hypothetical protein